LLVFFLNIFGRAIVLGNFGKLLELFFEVFLEIPYPCGQEETLCCVTFWLFLDSNDLFLVPQKKNWETL